MTTEQLTEWLEIIQKYPDNVTHWDAKQQPKPVLREARTYDGDALYSTVSDEEEEVEEHVDEPVIEDQDVVVRFNDPDESMIQEHRSAAPKTADPYPSPTVSGWLDVFAQDSSVSRPYQ